MTINMDGIEKIIFSHMNDQPYEIVCENCGGDLQFYTTVEDDLDLHITVTPCKCILEKE